MNVNPAAGAPPSPKDGEFVRIVKTGGVLFLIGQVLKFVTGSNSEGVMILLILASNLWQTWDLQFANGRIAQLLNLEDISGRVMSSFGALLSSGFVICIAINLPEDVGNDGIFGGVATPQSLLSLGVTTLFYSVCRLVTNIGLGFVMIMTTGRYLIASG